MFYCSINLRLRHSNSSTSYKRVFFKLFLNLLLPNIRNGEKENNSKIEQFVIELQLLLDDYIFCVVHQHNENLRNFETLIIQFTSVISFHLHYDTK